MALLNTSRVPDTLPRQITSIYLSSCLRGLLVLVVILVLVSSEGNHGMVTGVNQCVRDLKPLTRNLKSPYTLRGQIVIPSYIFACSGVIQRWSAQVKGCLLNKVHFQVWRIDPVMAIHRLVGENVIDVESYNRGLSYNLQETILSLHVTDPSQQIRVAPGDIIGVFVDREGDVKILYKLSSTTVTFTANVPRPLQGFVSPLILDPSFQSRLRAAPLINVDVNETVEVTTLPVPTSPTKEKVTHISTNIPSPTPDFSGDGQNYQSIPYELIVGLTVGGITLIALGTGLIVVIACCVSVKRRNQVTQNPSSLERRPPQGQSSILNILPLLDTPQRNVLAAFKKQTTMREVAINAKRTRPVAEVNLNIPNSHPDDIELSYAYPITNASILRTNSTDFSKSRAYRKHSTHANVPLPEIPIAIELKENPSYASLSNESLDQVDMARPTDTQDGDNVYDVPMFNRRPATPPIEYEIPVASFSFTGGQFLESPTPSRGRRPASEVMYSEIFD